MPPSNTTAHPHRTPSSGSGSERSPGAGATKRVEDEEVKPYVLAGELGKGSFAIVYKGFHEQTHEQVAIKTVSRSILTSKLFDNLQSEIDILKSLSHRHITKLIDIVRAERNIYLIMEYCSGGDLTTYIKKRGRIESLEYIPSLGAAPIYYPHPRIGGLDEIVVRSFLRQLARALKFLRQRNLIHRDIKPQNLLLKPASLEESARGHPLGVPILKVADFGFARSLPNAMMAETLCGSPLYMAPEILRYEKYDAKADLWSVGAVLYETAVGKPPFRAQNHIELLKKIEHAKTVKFPDEDPAYLEREQDIRPVPNDIKKLIRSLLKRYPAERASYDDFFGSTALARSKFPRPGANASGDPSASSKGASQDPAAEEQEAVVIGTLRKKPRNLPIAEVPSSEQHQAISPVEVSDPKPVAPVKFNFRRGSGTQGDGNVAQDAQRESDAFGDRAAEPQVTPGRVLQHPLPMARLLSTEASIIPGETEEDGFVRREYVMVGDTKAIEFNRTVDEMSAGRRRPLRDRKSGGSSPVVEKRQSGSYPPEETAGPVPSTSNMAFPPSPKFLSPPLSSSPSRGSALTRALNLASKKLFGATGTSRMPLNNRERDPSSSPRRQPLILGRAAGDEAERDPMEEELLTSLEELAQKTDVLTRWADEIYEYVKAVPQKPLPQPSKFAKRDGESDRHAERRKNADTEAEYNAVTCVALYLLLMTFSQKGIDKLRIHQEGMKMRDPEGNFEVSEGFDDALTWFKDHFLKCNDRAALVKTWLSETSTVGQTWLGQLVYDRALQLSRKAARMELLDHGSSCLDCEQLYEESLWCLYALQDDIMQSGDPFQEQDATTIANWILRTKRRLIRCRARREMNEEDRLKDAIADQNMDDIRYPSPLQAKSPHP